MSAIKYFAGIFVIICFAYASAEPLTCFSCRSDGDDEWAEKCVANDLNATADFPTVECGADAAAAESDGNDTDADPPTPKCYKTIITMSDAVSKTDYEIVTRGCEMSRMDGCSKSVAPQGGDYISCYCDSEGCNSAHYTSVAASVMFFGVLASLARHIF